MKICRRCVLDEGFPGIRFDEKGICNYCTTSKSIDQRRKLRDRYERKFADIVTKNRGKGSYDCLVAFSGGKDSTFTLYQMKNKYGMKALAVTFDNWFQSEAAQENIRNVIRNMGVDHVTVTPDFTVFRNIVKIALTRDLFSKKALERATTVCTSCLSMVRFTCVRMAIEKMIPIVVLGMSPGQAPTATSVFKMNADMMRKMQDAIFQPMSMHVGDALKPYFLEERHFQEDNFFPYSVNPLAFLEYHEDEMYRIISNLGWKNPKDTDSNSTNCLLNGLANQVHQERFGFHPYAFEVAGMVREGYLTREEGLMRLSEPPDDDVIARVKEILDR